MKRIALSLLVLLAACAGGTSIDAMPAAPDRPAIPEGRTPEERREIFRTGVSHYERGELATAEAFLANASVTNPVLADHAVRFLATIAELRGDAGTAIARWTELLRRFDRSVWRGDAALAVAGSRFEAGDPSAATRWLDEADRQSLDPAASARALWLRSRIERSIGQVARARSLSARLRERFPGSPEARTASDEAWAEREEIALASARTAAEEIGRLLTEGRPDRALELVGAATRRFRGAADQALLRWFEADALLRSGRTPEAETVLDLLRRRFPQRPEAAKALFRLARIAWNRDEDEIARKRFESYVRAYPKGADAAEALYAVGRIHQEAGRLSNAIEAFERLRRSHPRSALAAESTWRIGWCAYRAGEYRRAEEAFRKVSGSDQASALYWRARATERRGRSAGDVYRLLLRKHPESYYSMLAEGRLGSPPGAALDERTATPSAGAGALGSKRSHPHVARFIELQAMELRKLARLELAAIDSGDSGVDPVTMLHSWVEVDGYREAVRLAARRDGCDPKSALATFCYPRAFWKAVLRESRRRSIDPYLVLALMRQESLFDPEALSPADARGLMQLLPSTAARTVRSMNLPATSVPELFDADRNIAIGTAHLRELLDHYGGDEILALAAYNAGAGAVEKWKRRYPDVEEDEFVDSISYRETRNYVKKVLQNRRIYRVLYPETPAASS